MLKRIWRRLKGFRTVVVNALIGLAAAALVISEQFTGFNWRDWMEPKYAPLAVIALNVLNTWLRSVTTTPMGKAQ